MGRPKISVTHFRECTPGELLEILLQSGFTVNKIVGLGFFPGMGRLQKQHKRLVALDLWLGTKMLKLAGGMMVASRKAETD